MTFELSFLSAGAGYLTALITVCTAPRQSNSNISMPKSRSRSRSNLSAEILARVEPTATQPKTPTMVEMDAGPTALSEGDRVAGLVKEYSGWDVYSNEARKVDTELVKDWTASLNFLLLFAAIFAAVLTAFIIESKKLLEPDQTAIMVNVMMFYTNSVANGTHQQYTLPEFQASSTDVTINCLFFASLSASLVAALASVVSLQWVADYDAAITRGGSSPEDRANRRQFRYAGVVSWKMGEIIAALPILLYCSVILFFTGLILWMTVINHIVGVVVAGGAAVAILFYGASTIISVIFVSAPFRTPLSRGIYTLCHLPFSGVYALVKMRTTLSIPPWLEKQHLIYTNARKRVDLAVENKGELGRDALVWLANQLSISHDSYRQLILLVGELSNLHPEHMPSFDTKEASWYDIFDLLGWRFLATTHLETVNGEEKRRMEIMQRCYAIPGVRAVTNPPAVKTDSQGHQRADYWDQFCDGTGGRPRNENARLPNHLYLLLRDTPSPFNFSPPEMEVIIKLGRWRNSISKPPQVWEEVFALAPSFHFTFFGSCIVIFANFIRSQYWRRRNKDDKRRYISIASELVQIAIHREDFSSPPVTLLLIQANEAMLIGFGNTWTEGAACLSRPLRYGRAIQQSHPDEHLVHDSIILLLSRRIQSYPRDEWALRVREVIAMLWLRPSNPVPRRWETIKMRHGRLDQWDLMTIMDWLQLAHRTPHIIEILRHLAKTQAEDPSIGPLWRTTATGGVNDPHFIEALQMFDHLMTDKCSAWDHCMMINLVCQDLELEETPNFEHYFTRNCLNALRHLHDPCLRLLAICASGSYFVDSIVLTAECHAQWALSLDRIEEYLLKSYPEGGSSRILALKASLWPEFSGQNRLCRDALGNLSVLSHLQRIFRHSVPCAGCHDGVGHLFFHVVQENSPRRFYTDLNGFSKNSRAKPSKTVDLIILWRLFMDADIWLGDILQSADDQCLRELTRMLHDIKVSLSSSLSHIWNVVRYHEGGTLWAGDLAVLSTCTRNALQLPDDESSALLLSPLASSILRVRDALINRGNGMLGEWELAADQALNTSQRLLSRLVSRMIVGRRNAAAVSCARARGVASPSIMQLAPYEE